MKDEEIGLMQVGLFPYNNGKVKNSMGTRVYDINGKSKTQSALGGGWGAKTGLYAIPVRVEDEK